MTATPDRDEQLRPLPGPEAPTCGEGAARARRVLEDTADIVATSWSYHLADAIGAEEIRATAAWLLANLATDAEVTRTPPPREALTRFLLGRLAAATVPRLALDPNIDKADALQLLCRIERLRTRLEPDWERYFSSQVEGPDGLDLVREVLHDLRSPLTSIRVLAEILERGKSGPVTEGQGRQLRLIYGAAQHLGSLADDALAMAKRREMLIDADATPFSLTETFENIAAVLRPIAEEKGLSMEFGHLPDDIRLGRPIALTRVLLNLVTNALKFTEQGGVAVQVEAITPTRVRFRVVDTGPGISETALPELFRPFQRNQAEGRRSDFRFSGTGLGLALCRRITAALGTELELQTALGEGTTFSFELDLPPSPTA